MIENKTREALSAQEQTDIEWLYTSLHDVNWRARRTEVIGNIELATLVQVIQETTQTLITLVVDAVEHPR